MVTTSPQVEAPPAFELNDTDREVLALTDEQFHAHTWEELKGILASNRLEVLKRKPSDLVRYIAWSAQTKAQYGSITDFICQRRLRWEPRRDVTSSPDAPPEFAFRNPVPFAEPDDYRVLRNDWPYGLEQGVTHLVVWLKTPIPVDDERGDLLPESRMIVERFIDGYFVQRLAKEGIEGDHVLWFKNWVKLQSVRGLDHVHVLVRDVPESILVEWTGMDEDDTIANEKPR